MNQNMSEEIWEEITKYDILYKVSNKGNIRFAENNQEPPRRFDTDKGHLVKLYNKTKPYWLSIAKIVAEVYIEKYNPDIGIKYKNSNKACNI